MAKKTPEAKFVRPGLTPVAVDLLADICEPADEFATAGDYMTTLDLVTLMRSMFPEAELDLQFLAPTLKQFGYIPEVIDREIFWAVNLRKQLRPLLEITIPPPSCHGSIEGNYHVAE